ncbi:MAG: helix-turn-helix transcriptional regulator [Lacibacter sp.]|jgi:AraC-like DNA-binding protein
MNQTFKLQIHDGLAVYIGRQVITKLHLHHALEIVIAFDKPFLLSTNGVEFEKSECSIIAADLPHQFCGEDDFYIFIYLDAELSLALQLEKKLQLKKHGVIHYLDKEIAETRGRFIDWFKSDSTDDKDFVEIIHSLVEAITASDANKTGIEPRIMDALTCIQSSLHKEINLEAIASKVYLSESRFAHLFKEQTGIPFRRYVLWCRMQAALKAVMQGQSFTQAAYESGFADVAHLSRTFTEMFGVSPSEVLKQ